jgi:hypothetical protein
MSPLVLIMPACKEQANARISGKIVAAGLQDLMRYLRGSDFTMFAKA